MLAALLLTGSACSPAEPALPLGTPKTYSAGGGEVALAVDDIRAATDDEVAEYGLRPPSDQSLWFVTYSISLVSGAPKDLDPSQVYPVTDDWTAETDRGGTVQQTQVMGAGFDCTADQSATQGISAEAPFVNCVMFQTGPDAALESVTVGDHGTWTTKP